MSHIDTSDGESKRNLRVAERFFLHTSRSAFLFAVADDEVVRDDCSAILRFLLSGKGKTLRIHEWEREGEGLYPAEQLRILLKKYPDTDGLILIGLDAVLYRHPDFLEQLNVAREALSSFGIPMLFWLSKDSSQRVNREALDLLSQRAGGMLYFSNGDEHEAVTVPDVPAAVYESGCDKGVQSALEARLRLLQQQLEEAEREQDDPSERATDIVLELLRLYARIPGSSRSVQSLLERYYHLFDLENPEVCTVVAEALAEAGDSERASLLFEKALPWYREQAETNPEVWLPYEAKTLTGLARAHWAAGDVSAAEQEYGDALSIYRKVAAANPLNRRSEIAEILSERAHLYSKSGAFSAAGQEYEEALRLYRELAAADPPRWMPEVARTLNNLSTVQTARNDMTTATLGYQEALKITAELDNAVTWLHVSDFHLREGALYEQEVILRSLVASVKRFRKEGYLPDLIFVTGDIAESGKAEEYAFATQFFDDLLAAAGLEKRRLFLVPGNHDVDRTVNEFLPRTLESDQSSDRFFNPAGVPIRSQFQRLQPFSDWYNSYFAGIRTFPADTTSAVEVVQIRKSLVAILSLNSALFSVDKDDHGKLLLGRRCLDKAIKELQEHAADLNIALLHHPLDWLSQVERGNIRATLGLSVDLLLHGHYHETDTESIVSQHGGYLKLGAGAAYQTREWPNRAMYATFRGSQVSIFPIRYEDTPLERWTLDTALFSSPSYIGTFTLPKRTDSDTAEASPVAVPASELFYDYHEALRGELETINLLGTHALENVPVGLTDTFVSLRISDTWRSDRQRDVAGTCNMPEQDEQIRAPEDVMRLVFEKKRLMLIVGDPGSGKTTLLKHYALTGINNREKLGFNEPLLVVFLPLRDLVIVDGAFAPLSANLVAWSELHDLEIQGKAFSFWLQKRTTLLLFDGLDEIADPEQRIKACRWIDRIVSRYTRARAVVTSRATGYRKAEGIELASRHTRADIMDFTIDQEREFLERWFGAVYRDELKPSSMPEEKWEKRRKERALKKAETILAFLGKEENRSLQALARVPMLLQIMATLWKEREYLPGSRVELYEASLAYILDYRDRQKNIDPLLKAKDALRVLAPVSLWMQEDLGKDEAGREQMQEQMQLVLNTLTPRHMASEFCKNLVERAGLLVEYRDNEYLFRHKSFREYLAGLQLKEDRDKPNRIATLAEHFGNDWWAEPLRFFIAQVDARTFDLFMQKLFDSPVSGEMTQKQQDLLQTLISDAPAKKVDALKQKLLDPQTTLNRQRYLLDSLKAIDQPEAREAVQQFALKGLSKERQVAAAVVQDRLGAEYILINGGTFSCSFTKQEEEMPALYMGKYTVTNRLYRRFIGYLETKEPDFARILPLKTYQKNLDALAESIEGFTAWLDAVEPLSKRLISGYDDDKRFNGDDHPVVGVSWYAARAYSLWLSLLESDGGSNNRYRLPTEMEWEYAAAGQSGREYPWPAERGEPTPKLANYNGNEGGTTPVGRYPDGATPEGLCDMAGNVWEWCIDWYSDRYYKECEERGIERNPFGPETGSSRVIRGGSWGSLAGYCRSSFRSLFTPDNRDSDVGFRPVFVP
ncbi:MAG: SUMF1/EgtB/PvdO family nonheme iron enzyme [Chlorobium sp.]|jgi:formylglycine-generating enzyme required for sulfatase activity/tetratricopeptide (TPR) repeat protein/energy-coupling factor transporter ATP-binding protein EcfA2|nr:SUMF1/EgtB/PvdO family nonheme iron enzyme [Chlorobium sp.]